MSMCSGPPASLSNVGFLRLTSPWAVAMTIAWFTIPPAYRMLRMWYVQSL